MCVVCKLGCMRDCVCLLLRTGQVLGPQLTTPDNNAADTLKLVVDI